jgi:hypothetical protein
MKIERQIERLNRTQPWIDTSRVRTLEDLKLAAERIEFFNFDPPPELAGYTHNTWYAVPGGYRLSLPDGEWLSIETNLLDTWDVQHTLRDGSTLITRAPTLTAAVQTADRFVSVQRPDAVLLVEQHARWRNEPPTDKQKEVLARNKIPVPKGLTRGQAWQMISLLMSSHTSNWLLPLKRSGRSS